MKKWHCVWVVMLIALMWGPPAEGGEGKSRRAKRQKSVQTAQNSDRRAGGGAFETRFAQGTTLWGGTLGYGYTFDLPRTNFGAPDRTNMDFFYVFPHFKYNVFGLLGDSFYRGALYWVVEAGAAVTVSDSTRVARNPLTGGLVNLTTDNAPQYQFGFVPIQGEYKFLSPFRRWAPYVIVGAGFSYGNFNDGAVEISTDFEFILNAGAGVEYFLDNNKSISMGYRLWHLSNSNIERPNIGLNAHLFTVGFSF